MPAADIEPRNLFAGSIFSQGGRPLHVTVEMVIICGCHPCIILMAKPVPYTVFFTDSHMAHLDRKKIFKHRLPDAPVINILRNAENGRALVSVTELI